ncbi:hypothetical protein BDV06DRAFT_49266 [Aspergillus oleicola]
MLLFSTCQHFICSRSRWIGRFLAVSCSTDSSLQLFSPAFSFYSSTCLFCSTGFKSRGLIDILYYFSSAVVCVFIFIFYFYFLFFAAFSLVQLYLFDFSFIFWFLG